MLSWEEYDEKETKLVKKRHQEQTPEAPKGFPIKEEKEQLKVAPHTGNLSGSPDTDCKPDWCPPDKQTPRDA